MAVKTYVYRPLSLQSSDLTPLLPPAAVFTIGDPIPDSRVHISIEETQKPDLDDAMSSFGYVFVEEYTDPAPVVSRTDFGVLSADPVGAVPMVGDYYYNDALQMEMKYDGLRSKWLSVESSTFMFGRDNNTQPGQFYRTGDDRVMSSVEGWHSIRSGTIISIGYTRTDTDAATFEMTSNGVTIASLLSSAVSGRQVTTDGDFSFNEILGARNGAIGAVTSNVTGWVRVKWRV